MVITAHPVVLRVAGTIAAALGLAACSARSPSPSLAHGPPASTPRASDTPSAIGPEIAAEGFLRSMDIADFDSLWSNRDPSLEPSGIDRVKLEQLIRASRPDGSIPNRTRIASKRLTLLPRRPVGEYVLVEWETTFPNAGTAIEFVVVSKGADNRWRFVGSRIAMAEPVER